jgi:hypothetical protein
MRTISSPSSALSSIAQDPGNKCREMSRSGTNTRNTTTLPLRRCDGRQQLLRSYSAGTLSGTARDTETFGLEQGNPLPLFSSQ